MFIDNLAGNGNKRQSAIAAGFAAKNASNAAARMLKRERVSKALEQVQHATSERTATGPDAIRRELWLNSRAAQEKGNIAASNRALALLGKANGMFSDKLELSNPDGSLSAPASDDETLARRSLLLARRVMERKQDEERASSTQEESEPHAEPPPATH